MEMQIKKTIKAGNSSAVVLPRSWLNKEVRVELVQKTDEIILSEVLEIISDSIQLGSVIGIYLAGSYARGEQESSSDIDILVITDNVDREMIKKGIYNILIASSKLISQKLEINLLPIAPMIKEARSLLNRDYIKNIEINVTKKNVKWYLETTKEKLKMINEYIEYAEKTKKSLDDQIAYTLVLRIRTLEIIKKLIQNKNYSKKDLITLINQVSQGQTAYERYEAFKSEESKKSLLKAGEAKRLYEYLKKDLEKTKKMIKQ